MASKAGLPVVLVVDDDAGRRVHVASILRDHGFPCASTSPVPAALKFAARLKPDLVLARRGGRELLVDVRRALPAARVVLFAPSTLQPAEPR